MKYCNNCNKEYNDNINFCPICGNQIGTPEEQIKYCPNCGKELNDSEKFCPNCGKSITATVNNYNDITVAHPQGIGVILAFMIVSCVLSGLLSIGYGNTGNNIGLSIAFCSLFWKIPMTIHFKNFTNARLKVSTGFKVCTLIFVSLVSGIIMLCNKDL